MRAQQRPARADLSSKPMYRKTDIRLGKGIGDLLFGSSKDEVQAYLGKPDEIGHYSYDREGLENYETWKYADLGILATFDEEYGFVLARSRHILTSARLVGDP